MTGIDVLFHWGSANSALDDAGQRTTLFNSHGPFKFKQWAAANYPAGDIKTFLIYLETNHANEDRTIIAKGEADFYQATVLLKHFFTSGLFGELRLPFRTIKTHGIELEAEPGSSTSAACTTYIRDNLDTVLRALAIEPWQSEFEAQGIGDTVLGGGWQGQEFYDGYFLNRVSGQLRVGAIVPSSSISQPQKDYLFSLPMGYNFHWGCEGAVGVEAEIAPFLIIGGTATSKVFFKHTRSMRLKTDKKQNGPLMLDVGNVKVDHGSIWDVGVYAKSGIPTIGTTILLGYSYYSQEQTFLTLTDRELAKDSATPPLRPFKDAVVNSDSMLEPWNEHVLHMGVVIEPKISISRVMRPRAELIFSYPLAGKRAPIANIRHHGMSASIVWEF